MKLSTIVIDYRKRLQISQREFARRCGLSNSYISFIENEYNPRTGKPIVPTLETHSSYMGGFSFTSFLNSLMKIPLLICVSLCQMTLPFIMILISVLFPA